MPREEDIQEARFARLDQAIARDIERRRRSHKLYWALLVAAVLLAVLGLVHGRTAGEVAEEVAQKTAKKTAEKVAGSGEFAEALTRSSPFLKQVDESVGDAFDDYASGPEFRVLLQDAAGEVVRGRFADVVAELETFRRALTQMEKTQTGLARRLEKQLAMTEDLSARLGKVSSQLEEVGAGLEELTEALRQSQPVSFLLKENELTWLPGPGIQIKLGPRHRDGVEGVKIWEGKGEGKVPLFPKGPDFESGATLHFGTSFEFVDGQGKQYKARLTNAQSRFWFWFSDFIGLDLAVTSPPQIDPARMRVRSGS